jgi:putative endonuclease
MSRLVGGAAERRAARFLKRRAYRIVDRNIICGRLGELDIVALDGDVLVFVEVRYRGSKAFGSAAATVGPIKQRKLARAAQHYLGRNRHEGPVRFDIVAIDGGDVELIVDAFRPAA